MDSKHCFLAVRSRDRRFDGRFFTAVRTTGVYCRPICPAPTPKFENVQFFPCAAAAEAAGFRPCRRCRPEASPGTPAWSGTSSSVSRALKLIDRGALDEDTVEVLAARVGVSGRHLRRLFLQHLGASPLAVAQTRRLHLARRLIRETTLSMTEIAFAAGFSSLRRFNAAMRGFYGRPPSALRTKTEHRKGPDRSQVLELRLHFRPPLDWKSLLHFLAERALPGVEEVEERTYRRTARFETATGIIEMRFLPRDYCLLIRVPEQLSPWVAAIAERARCLFDLHCDPAPIASRLSQDPTLAALLKARPGLRVPGAWDAFETSVRAVIGQQVSVAGARTLCARLVHRCGAPLPREASPEERNAPLRFTFPTPRVLMDADLSGLGLTSARVHALKSLAEAVMDGSLDFGAAGDLEETVRRLTRLPGIGSWTAQYIALRAMGEPDAFPAGDLGVRRALAAEQGRLPSEPEAIERAEAWRPWRAYATLYLWNRDAVGPAAATTH